jgi:hypothetical protein
MDEEWTDDTSNVTVDGANDTDSQTVCDDGSGELLAAPQPSQANKGSLGGASVINVRAKVRCYPQ